MPTESYRVGPGVLILGAGPLAIQKQLTSCKVTPSEAVTTSDPEPVLDGTEIPGDEDARYSFTLSGTLLQDLTVAGVVEWTWNHAGEDQPFTFVPNAALERGVTGIFVPVPLSIGGDVKARAKSDFEWRIKGTPVFGEYDPVEGDVTEDV